MGKGRVEAFSDGVIAIIITIMVLELHAPHETTLAALVPEIPIFLSYVLSFVFVGIYWNNHHHLFHAVTSVNGAVLWANLLFLFTLSLIPFVTAWMGENHLEAVPVALYGGDLVMCALAYAVLLHFLLKNEGAGSGLARAIGHNVKGYLSLVLYVIGIAFAFINVRIAIAFYAVVSVIWFVPDPRIEKVVR
ncbi:MAG TPA: TMEM175 family protein [Kaistia sp.]|nr:TMEM175 family protein [Kaistia sp.]